MDSKLTVLVSYFLISGALLNLPGFSFCQLPRQILKHSSPSSSWPYPLWRPLVHPLMNTRLPSHPVFCSFQCFRQAQTRPLFDIVVPGSLGPSDFPASFCCRAYVTSLKVVGGGDKASKSFFSLSCSFKTTCFAKK